MRVCVCFVFPPIQALEHLWGSTPSGAGSCRYNNVSAGVTSQEAGYFFLFFFFYIFDSIFLLRCVRALRFVDNGILNSMNLNTAYRARGGGLDACMHANSERTKWCTTSKYGVGDKATDGLEETKEG